MNVVPHVFFRFATQLFAIVLGVLFIWLLLPEMSRPSIQRLPTDQASAAAAEKWRSAASFAASIAVIRGDLWAESAFTYSNLLWDASGPGKDLAQELQDARLRLENALELAPHESAAWLLLAGLASRYPSQGLNATEALRMSYYTGPSERDFMPLRLRLTANLNPLGDVELKQFASRDVRSLLALKQISALSEAYRDASPTGRRFIEQTVADIDPSVVASLRAGEQQRNQSN
jgi:hypothetical protein